MISRAAQNISSAFVRQGIVKKEDEDIYSYSFEVLISTVINSLMVLILALAFGRLRESVFFAIVFVTLRPLCGGFHARNHLKCISTMFAVFMLYILFLNIAPAQGLWAISLFMAAFGFATVWLLAPQEDANKPLSEKEFITYKKKSRACASAFAILIIISACILPQSTLAFSAAVGYFFVAVLLIAAKIKNTSGKREKTNENA